MPSFVRDLFKWALAFPGNRSWLCIFTDKKLVGLGLDVRCLDGGALAGFPVRGPSPRLSHPHPLGPAPGMPCVPLPVDGARSFADPSRRSLWLLFPVCIGDRRLIRWKLIFLARPRSGALPWAVWGGRGGSIVSRRCVPPPPRAVLEPVVIGHRAFKREIPFLSGVVVSPTTPPAKWGLERVWFRLQKVPDLPWILCRCFRCFKTEHREHGEPCGCLNSPETPVLGVPGDQGCATASLARLCRVGGCIHGWFEGYRKCKAACCLTATPGAGRAMPAGSCCGAARRKTELSSQLNLDDMGEMDGFLGAE